MKRTANTYLFDLVSKRNNACFDIAATAYSEAEARAAIVAYYAHGFDICDKAKEIAEPNKYFAQLDCL